MTKRATKIKTEINPFFTVTKEIDKDRDRD